MAIPTEAIGSIPRTARLVSAIKAFDEGRLAGEELELAYDDAVRKTVAQLEATGSPIIGDGEQRKTHSFATYPTEGMKNLAQDGFILPFADGHTRCLPRLTAGPFRYGASADRFVARTRLLTRLPIKQSVISPSALSLFYPETPLVDYPWDVFISHLVAEHVGEVRRCFAAGAEKVQIDFTEGRLAVKIDPSLRLLRSFVDIVNMGLSHLTAEERRRVGVHTCPGNDLGSTHSLDTNYMDLLPSLFQFDVGSFYIAMACESDRTHALKMIGKLLRPGQIAFIGVTDPAATLVETPEEICESVVEIASYLPAGQFGTTDDCGFSPFCDNSTTTRDTAFAKIRSRVIGTALASQKLKAA
ncbi:MAG: 5-methyltetrahydropteroyltriglutamate--homocysteine methyltransferase [Silvibacterium sp.]|nr:5-methyltetrahydropteroyltriglutamate--homocysteine methyltransferase [Silvibacterium sp.]